MSAYRGFGAPFRYVQGPGALKGLPGQAKAFGPNLLAVIDPFLFDGLSAELEGHFAGSGLKAIFHKFGGECSLAEIDNLIARAGPIGPGAVCGLGGGKTLDAAKLTAHALQKPVIICPTSASTDAPVSAMGVVYHPDGRHLRCQTLPHAPDLVLVDSALIARAPLRLFVAGIGDALSTNFEAQANALSGTRNYVGPGYRPTLAGRAVAEACHRAVLDRGLAAVADLAAGRLTEAVEDVIEANILLSGLGFENNGCAGAHALHTGIHEIPGSSRLYHGEVVAFGILFQLALERAQTATIDPILDFMGRVGLPLTFADMGLHPSPENLSLISGRILDGNSGVEAEPFPVTKDSVHAALGQADRLGADFRRRHPDLPRALCQP
ncbi:MAG: glycerol dehydrogenase [Deltaproteobacteria bacterium]|jgi:glycerol dehydrogenase|nr:glycerol dehydrogenase [Deltaproteobacteria bacterium]